MNTLKLMHISVMSLMLSFILVQASDKGKTQQTKPSSFSLSKLVKNPQFYGSLAIGAASFVSYTLLTKPSFRPVPALGDRYLPSNSHLALLSIGSFFVLAEHLGSVKQAPSDEIPSLPSCRTLKRLSQFAGVGFGATWVYDALYGLFNKKPAHEEEKKRNEKLALKELRDESQTKLQVIPKETFADIVGGPPEELDTLVDMLKNREAYKKLGATLPKGYLFVGPPGTGKTALARALAGETKVPFFATAGATFQGPYAGSGAKAVRQFFKDVREAAGKHGGSIGFIDELDGVGSARDEKTHDSRRETMTALLNEMDGFHSNSDVVLIGATNKLEDLDPALTRAGRFDGIITVPLPDVDRRRMLLQHFWNKLPFKAELTVDHAQRYAEGMSSWNCAAVETLVKNAVLKAARQRAERVDLFHLDHAILKAGGKPLEDLT